MRPPLAPPRAEHFAAPFAALLVMLLAACAPQAPCPPGEDCRWRVDTPRVGLWSALDPAPAVVLRVGVEERRVVTMYLVWERCGAATCPWTPPTAGRRLARQDNGAWVVSLARSAFARDPASEVLVPLADGSRARVGFSVGRLDAAPSPATDLPTCMNDLRATLRAAESDVRRSVLDLEIELVCRVWLHPQQGRSDMRWHPALHAVARAHACDMAERTYFAHTDPDGIGPNGRARDAGYALPEWYDVERESNNIESLALRVPVTSPDMTLSQWLDSPLHRRHVLAETAFKAAQADTATGYCEGERDGAPAHYWVFLSAQPAP